MVSPFVAMVEQSNVKRELSLLFGDHCAICTPILTCIDCSARYYLIILSWRASTFACWVHVTMTICWFSTCSVVARKLCVMLERMYVVMDHIQTKPQWWNKGEPLLSLFLKLPIIICTYCSASSILIMSSVEDTFRNGELMSIAMDNIQTKLPKMSNQRWAILVVVVHVLQWPIIIWTDSSNSLLITLCGGMLRHYNFIELVASLFGMMAHVHHDWCPLIQHSRL